MYFWEAFLIGLLGSFHCIGMCGPIALALPLRQQTWLSKSSAAILYNLGRGVTYALIGAIFGLFGKGLSIAGLQQVVSISLGAIMILVVLFPTLFRRLGNPLALNIANSRLKSALAKRFDDHSFGSLFLIGLLNGLLPCGLVYLAVAGAIASSDVSGGALYMFFFGLGTLPMMLALSMAGSFVNIKFRNAIRKAIPYAVVIIGLLFILRGMNLGIPMVSPKVEKQQTHTTMDCCKPENQ